MGAVGDWSGLARSLFDQAFSKDFFDSTFETMDATGFKLEVTHAGLDELVNSLVEADSSIQDPLTNVTPVCPTVASSTKLEPEVTLQRIIIEEPNVPVDALWKVYRREDGWGSRCQ